MQKATFWWDNFDRNIETVSGAGSIHNTPGIVFQEQSKSTITCDTNVSIPKSKRRSITTQEEYHHSTTINPKAEPPSFAESIAIHVEQETEESVTIYYYCGTQHVLCVQLIT